MTNKSHCKVCNKELSKVKYTLCKSCSFKRQFKKGIRTHLGSRNPNFKNKKPHCIDCHKPLKNYAAKRCHSCARIELYKNPENHPNYKDGRTLIIKHCLDCNKKISIEAIRCKKCARQGSLHPNWKDGTGSLPYTRDFIKIRDLIRIRDKNKCVICGMSKEEHFKKYRKNLEVHHKDHNRQNSRESNLETRCKQCNLNDNYKK